LKYENETIREIMKKIFKWELEVVKSLLDELKDIYRQLQLIRLH